MSAQIVTLWKLDRTSGDLGDSGPLKLFTIGYQGVDFDTYLNTLTHAGVSVVADVRETAWSHKRAFCKNVMREGLSKAGIEYVHIKSAGNPKENRRTAINMTECLKRYRYFLVENPTGVSELVQLVRTAAASEKAVCLTCFEKDAHECHRSILVEAITKQVNIRPVHL